MRPLYIGPKAYWLAAAVKSPAKSQRKDQKYTGQVVRSTANSVDVPPSQVHQQPSIFITYQSTSVDSDHAGRERLFHSLDHATEVGRDIGFNSVRVEEHF